MNKQLKTKDGKVIGRGIEWTDYTINPVGGCFHGCKWRMPDGTLAICYADSTAKVMQNAYSQGFEHHYWRPHMLVEPLGQKTPSRIFIDSMADLMGHWVPKDQVEQVLEMCRQAHWHTFQLLTKNAPNYLKFTLPKNVWAGTSAPPTFMHGNELTPRKQDLMVIRQLDILYELIKRGHPVCWMSIEPLSFDITEIFIEWCDANGHENFPLKWAVIGAASNGPKYFQPAAMHTQKLHDFLIPKGVKIFHKGNLSWTPHLEEFPETNLPGAGQLEFSNSGSGATITIPSSSPTPRVR